jgi:predicted dehydrogenase
VLCEKPLCHSLEDALRVREIVSRSGISFMQSFPKRFDPVNHEILAHVRSGALGRITLCRVRHGHSHGFSPDFRRAWFVDPARSGGGTLLDEGVHAADFLRWIFGEPESAWATISSDALGMPVEDTAAATFRYADGLIAEVTTSWCFAAADASVEIYGTEGTILLSGVDIASRPTRDADFLRIYRKEGESGLWTSSPTIPHFKTGVFHEHVAWTFADALRHGKPMPVGLDDGFKAFVMIDAAYAAARSGKAVKIVYPGG